MLGSVLLVMLGRHRMSGLPPTRRLCHNTRMPTIRSQHV